MIKWMVPIIAWTSAGAATVGTAAYVGGKSPVTVLLVAIMLGFFAAVTSGQVSATERPAKPAAQPGATAEDVR